MARALKYLFSKIELIAKNTLSTSSKSYYLPSGNRFSKRFYSLDVVSDDVIPKPSERLYIPRRAVLYVPGNDEKKLMKIPSFELDCAVMDLEDGVALTRKEEARIVIRHMLEELKFGQTECVVRVNAVSSGLMEDDMKSVFKAKNLPQTLMLPKVHKAEELDRFTKILMSTVAVREKKQKFRLVVFVESAIGLLNLRSIFRRGIDLALKEKLFDFDGVVFGSDDFCADIGATRTTEGYELSYARQKIVTTAKAYRLQAVDMVHIDYKDLDGLRLRALEGAAIGFTGKQVIHPGQIPIVQEAFSPTPEKVELAKEIIKAFELHQKSGKGAFTFQGDMIDMPLVLQARNTVQMDKAIQRKLHN